MVTELLTRLLQNSNPEPYCARSHNTTMWRDGLYRRHEVDGVGPTLGLVFLQEVDMTWIERTVTL